VINVTQAAAGATLSISPQQTAIVFAADGTTADNAAFTVTTNTGAWDVTVNTGQTWCTVSKTATSFTVSATENASATAPAPATVTVTATGATPIVINVTQAGNPLPTAKAALQAAIDAAVAAKDAVTLVNTAFAEGTRYEEGALFTVGTAADLPVGLKHIASNPATALEAAIATAQTALDNAATVAELEAATAALATATAVFNAVLPYATPGTLGLAARVSAAPGGTTIYLYGDEDDFVGVSATNISKAITLEGVGAERTITLAGNGSIFQVGTGGSLTLDANVTLKGKDGNTRAVVYVNGTGAVTMNEGSKITGNTSSAYGAGVHLNGAADIHPSLTMTGSAEISGNHVVSNGSALGGGVYAYYADVTMSGAARISGNSAESSGNYAQGGGLVLYYASNLTMSGSAEISDNLAKSTSNSATNGYATGGGIARNGSGSTSESVITMNDNAAIKNNRAESSFGYAYGGGVSLGSGSLVMNNDAKIEGNAIAFATYGQGSGIRAYRQLVISGNAKVTPKTSGTGYTAAGDDRNSIFLNSGSYPVYINGLTGSGTGDVGIIDLNGTYNFANPVLRKGTVSSASDFTTGDPAPSARFILGRMIDTGDTGAQTDISGLSIGVDGIIVD
jgi:hypothetical protein